MAATFHREYLVQLPLPLAQLYSRASNAKDPRGRYENAYYLFEALIKLTAAPLIAAYLQEVRHGGTHVEALDRQLTQLALPSLGQWVGMVREPAEPKRMLATVLFTDIVGSTEQAAALGDRRWRDLLETHHAVVRRELTRFQGREIDTAGDGFLAIFDQPAQAVHCACAISDAVRQLGVEIRAGLHTGECETVGDKIRGIAVHTGTRVAALAASGEILLSGTVKDLVAGAGIRFEDRGRHVLKGIPGEWRLFAVTRGDAPGRRAWR
jgi:class 3 adenylate cyclase